ncbi:MAG: diguanylate cyclase [Lachnospiraceae bacterium]|nr:diguanylate cyclase [Lachnospiraceae bacterium]
MGAKSGTNKNIFIRMIVLVLMFAAFVSIVLWIHVDKLMDIQENSMDSQITANTDIYSAKIEQELITLGEAVETAGQMLSRNESSPELEETALDALVSSTRADKAALLDMDGEGVNEEGVSVYYDPSYYIDNLYMGISTYHYLENGNIAVITPVMKDGNMEQLLLLEYETYKLDDRFANFNFGRDAWAIVVNNKGIIMYVFGGKNFDYLGVDRDFFEMLYQSKDADVARVLDGISRKTSGSATLSFASGDQLLYYKSIGIDNWSVIIGVPPSYIETQSELEQETIFDMLKWIAFGMVLFLAVVVFMSIMDKVRGKAKNEDLLKLAERDQLTGLYNKVTTENKIKEFIETHSDMQSLLFVLDIDNFKKINDTRGHAFGDEVLRSIGQQVRVLFRSSDILGRVGGDEFIIFLKGVKEDEFVLREAKKVEYFFQHFQAGEGYVKYSATASIGCAVFPRDAADFENLYKCADKALYTAKQRGKNQLAFYKEPE